MATYSKFECFVFDLGSGQHDLANDTLRWMLTNTAPNNNTHTVKGHLTEVTVQNGYNNAALSGQNWTQSANISTLASNADQVWTANGGAFGPFQYVIIYNNDATPDDSNNAALVCYWNYGSSISCNNGESFTVDIPANGTIANLT